MKEAWTEDGDKLEVWHEPTHIFMFRGKDGKAHVVMHPHSLYAEPPLSEPVSKKVEGERIEGWVNVYEPESGLMDVSTDPYPTRESALLAGRNYPNLFACIHISCMKGDGL